MSTTQAPPNYDLVISGTVAGLLKVRRSTVDQLSAAVGITRATLYRKIREGKWNANETGAIADAFRVDVDDLYHGRISPGEPLHAVSPFQSGVTDKSVITREYADNRTCYARAA